MYNGAIERERETDNREREEKRGEENREKV
jgi:hypothetical protein